MPDRPAGARPLHDEEGRIGGPPPAAGRKAAGTLLRALSAFFSLAVAAPAPGADLFLNDEPEVHAAVDKLNALGFLPGLLANTRPYTVRAVREAAARAASANPAPAGFEAELLRWVAAYAAPRRTARVTAAGSWSEDRFVPPNEQGIPVTAGYGGRGSLSAREETTPTVSGHLRALAWFGEGGESEIRLLDAALDMGTPSLSLQGGKISAWYGPGRHGALVLGNDAEPFPGLRLHNPLPIPMTGVLSFLGAVQYDLFYAWMDRKGDGYRTALVGMRLAARPARALEVGVSRALHYAGPGTQSGLSEFVETVIGSNHPPDRSNTIGGFDLTLTIPLRLQPVQLYWAPAGEHSKPDQWAHQAGLYLPKVLGTPRLDFRAEYADTYSWKANDIDWYEHGIYPHRYRGELLGHHLGAKSRDWFYEARWHFRPDAAAGLSYEHVQHNDAARRGERHDVAEAALLGWLSPAWRGEARARADRTTFEDNASGRERTDWSVRLALAYQVSAGVPGRAPWR